MGLRTGSSRRCWVHPEGLARCAGGCAHPRATSLHQRCGRSSRRVNTPRWLSICLPCRSGTLTGNSEVQHDERGVLLLEKILHFSPPLFAHGE